MASAQVLFLPWLRQGLAARLGNADTLGATLPASVDLTVTLGVTTPANNPSATVHVRGPGDVIGIDPRQVVRTEPAVDSGDFEAVDLAAIEFDNPDLPWLFTPAAADAQGRLRPWMCLVVVRQQDGVRLRPAGGEPLPVLEIAAPAKPLEELPDLAESWAWAHAQVSWPHDAPPDEAAVRELLMTRPELSVSRLLCARRLAPHTDYIACVVPTFDVGRRAGLNLPLPTNADLTPAWRHDAPPPARMDLPVYFHWTFRTGEREDFESIVDRLAPRDLSGGVGQRPIDISRPGFSFVADANASGLVALEGALQPVGMARAALAETAGASWTAVLQQILNAGAATPAAGDGDPLVGPPIYGRWLAGRDRVEIGATPTWLDELNLDPRERVAAGLGTRVVQAQQDELVAQAWAQAGEIAAANQRLRQVQLATAVGAKLLQRHVAPLTQGAAGQDDALWRFASPAQARLMLQTPEAPTTSASMLSLVARTGASAAALSAPMRRLTRNRGALARRSALLKSKVGVATPTTAPTGQLFVAFADPTLMMRIAPPARGFVSIDDVSTRMAAPNANLLFANMTDAAVAAAPKRPSFQIDAEPPPPPFAAGTVAELGATTATFAPRLRIPGDGPADPPDPPLPPRPPRPPIPPRVDSADGAAFRTAARRHLQLTNPAPLPIFVGPVILLSQLLSTQRMTVQAQLDPAPALQLRLQATLQTPAAAPPLPISGALGAVPRYAMPASEALARLSQDWLLPGLHNVPADTVALLETNPRFIEAFMLGLNVEMTRELVWRDFPLAHELGTYFDRFWRAARADKPPDIAPLVEWGTRRLGQNAPAALSGSSAKPLVLLLRSALLRRYPGTAVYAVRAEQSGSQRKPPAGVGGEKAPLFRGSLEPDDSFFGFDLDANEAIGNPGWYFVLQQQPTEPRFGFDDDVDFAGASHVSVQRRPSGMTLPASTPWAGNAAQLAQLIRQLPVRVLIHASELLPPPMAAPPPPAPPAPPPPRPPRPPRPPLIGPAVPPGVLAPRTTAKRTTAKTAAKPRAAKKQRVKKD
jgi:hypothetical protein